MRLEIFISQNLRKAFVKKIWESFLEFWLCGIWLCGTKHSKETLEPDNTSSDSVIQDSDLSLIEIVWSLENKSGFIYKVFSLCRVTTSPEREFDI